MNKIIKIKMYKYIILLCLICFVYNSKENMVFDYTFFNDEGPLITVHVPIFNSSEICTPQIGYFLPIGKNTTYECKRKLEADNLFVFLHPEFGPPYIRLFSCEIIPNQYYYIITNC